MRSGRRPATDDTGTVGAIKPLRSARINNGCTVSSGDVERAARGEALAEREPPAACASGAEGRARNSLAHGEVTDVGQERHLNGLACADGPPGARGGAGEVHALSPSDADDAPVFLNGADRPSSLRHADGASGGRERDDEPVPVTLVEASNSAGSADEAIATDRADRKVLHVGLLPDRGRPSVHAPTSHDVILRQATGAPRTRDALPRGVRVPRPGAGGPEAGAVLRPYDLMAVDASPALDAERPVVQPKRDGERVGGDVAWRPRLHLPGRTRRPRPLDEPEALDLASDEQGATGPLVAGERGDATIHARAERAEGAGAIARHVAGDRLAHAFAPAIFVNRHVRFGQPGGREKQVCPRCIPRAQRGHVHETGPTTGRASRRGSPRWHRGVACGHLGRSRPARQHHHDHPEDRRQRPWSQRLPWFRHDRCGPAPPAAEVALRRRGDQAVARVVAGPAGEHFVGE